MISHGLASLVLDPLPGVGWTIKCVCGRVAGGFGDDQSALDWLDEHSGVPVVVGMVRAE